MTDQNNTHSPRIDDQLAHDAAALTHGAPDDGRQEWRRDQVGTETEPTVTVDRDGSDAALDARTRLATSLVPSAFPGTGSALAEVAVERHAPDDVVVLLRSLPEGRVYATVAEVWDDLGGDVEKRPDTDTNEH